MFESRARLQEEIGDLLALLRSEGDGPYACLLEPGGVLLEDPAPDGAKSHPLRSLVDAERERLFRIPEELASGGPMEDAFGAWDSDEFLLAFVNRKVALVVACPDAEAFRARIDRPLRVLVDRLLRWKSAYRLDREGRGLFFSTPQLDIVVVGRRSE